MKTTAEEFLKLMRNSTLSREEQKMLINILPTLSVAQIDRLADLLRENGQEMEKILAEMDAKQKKAILKMQVALENVDVSEK